VHCYDLKCLSLPGAQLAIIKTAAENTFLTGLAEASQKSFVWIGLDDQATEGTWKWVSVGSQIAIRVWILHVFFYSQNLLALTLATSRIKKRSSTSANQKHLNFLIDKLGCAEKRILLTTI